MANRTRQVGPLHTRAEVGAVDRAARTVELTWSKGARVLRHSFWDGSFFEELSMDPASVRMGRLNSGNAPFLKDHKADTASVVGVIESARLDGGSGHATVRFVKEGVDPEADKLFGKIADSVIRNVSVGYRTYRMEQVEKGEGNTPVFRATDWEPFEVSAVAVGADADATFRSGIESHSCELFTREIEPMTEEEKKRAAEVEAKRQAELKAERDAATQLERERVSGINSAVRAAGLPSEFATKLVADGVTLNDSRAQVLAELERIHREPAIDARPRVTGVEGGDARDKFLRGMSAWIFEKGGQLGLAQKAKERGVKEFADFELNGGEFRGSSLADIARITLERAGVSLKGVYSRQRIIEMAFERASTTDFGTLFESALYKSMRAAYATQEDTWRRFVGTDTVSDFRAANRYMNASLGTLPVVAEGAEFRNVAIPDGTKVSISTETRGGIIALTRQAMINDDMGALLDLSVRFGRTASRSIEKAVYDYLALNSNLGPTMSDTNPFFYDSTRGNVSTSAALSVAALDADRVKMRQQMDSESNDYLDLNPSILLIPVGLESAAKILNESSYDHTGSALNKPNAVRGMFADIVSSPRLVSSTRRFLFTANKEAFKVVFLEGSGEGPVLETQDGWRIDGREWKARIDFKVNAFDPKQALTNAGT